MTPTQQDIDAAEYPMTVDEVGFDVRLKDIRMHLWDGELIEAMQKLDRWIGDTESASLIAILEKKALEKLK